MKYVIDGTEYDFVSESGFNGDLTLRREGRLYTFEREKLEQVARVFASIDAVRVE